ncbi:hypothetical protein EV182_004652 [Spiromyces aspiralis]|uniref:Uncharacterized protein n=1 Tax=Spiromyces aspiralis TaxID=68401 RepID=A0ACC1HNX8_9FUNG|nr:hypothetical protein EV182_004652 [Spiromyces aspiralis]
MFAILLLSVYVVADTQLLIDRAEHSPYGLDPVSGSLVLFSDFAQLLVRILVFLAERDQQRNTGRGPFRRSSSSSGSPNKGKRIERDDY